MSPWLPVVWLVVGAADLPAPAARLEWMGGHWAGVKDGVATEEHWTSPEGGALVGMHKEVRGGRMVGFEFLRIEPTGPSGLSYVASPRGAAPTTFALLELGPRRVVFANEAHDFPQRILYWLDANGALHARIEGRVRGQERHQEWVWSRVPSRP